MADTAAKQARVDDWWKCYRHKYRNQVRFSNFPKHLGDEEMRELLVQEIQHTSIKHVPPWPGGMPTELQPDKSGNEEEELEREDDEMEEEGEEGEDGEDEEGDEELLEIEQQKVGEERNQETTEEISAETRLRRKNLRALTKKVKPPGKTQRHRMNELAKQGYPDAIAELEFRKAKMRDRARKSAPEGRRRYKPTSPKRKALLDEASRRGLTGLPREKFRQLAEAGVGGAKEEFEETKTKINRRNQEERIRRRELGNMSPSKRTSEQNKEFERLDMLQKRRNELAVRRSRKQREAKQSGHSEVELATESMANLSLQVTSFESERTPELGQPESFLSYAVVPQG